MESNNTYHSLCPPEDNVLEILDQINTLPTESNSEREQLKDDCNEAKQSYENKEKLFIHLNSIKKAITNSIRFGNDLVPDFITSFKAIDNLSIKSAENFPKLEDCKGHLHLLLNIMKNMNQKVKDKKIHVQKLMDDKISSKTKKLEELESNFKNDQTDNISKLYEFNEDVNLITSKLNYLKHKNEEFITQISNISREKEEIAKQIDGMKNSIALNTQEKLDDLSKEEKMIDELTKEMNAITLKIRNTKIQEEIFDNYSNVQKQRNEELENEIMILASNKNIQKLINFFKVELEKKEYGSEVNQLNINEIEEQIKKIAEELMETNVKLKCLPIKTNLVQEDINTLIESEKRNVVDEQITFKMLEKHLDNAVACIKESNLKCDLMQKDITKKESHINDIKSTISAYAQKNVELDEKTQEVENLLSALMKSYAKVHNKSNFVQEDINTLNESANSNELKMLQIKERNLRCDILQNIVTFERASKGTESKISNKLQINFDLEQEIQEIKNNVSILNKECDFFSKIIEDLLTRELTEKLNNPILKKQETQ